MIVNRIVTKIFGSSGIDEERTRLHCCLDEVEHRAPIVLRGDLRKHFTSFANSKRHNRSLLAWSLTASPRYRQSELATDSIERTIGNIEPDLAAAGLGDAKIQTVFSVEVFVLDLD